tara:strand:+ start:191 stop:445 length:255 start_codon:yes stop_codon:yes gene_type:complete
MKTSPIRLKQKLSPKAKKAKAIRDKKAAMTKKRKDYKAESQMKRRAALKRGVNLKGKDYDHHTGTFVSSSKNRAGMTGKGTKNE